MDPERFQIAPTEVSASSDPTLLPLDSLLAANLAPVGGRLRFFLPNWCCITSDSWILSAVSGYFIEFADPPVQLVPPKPLSFDSAEAVLISSEVQQLLLKHAIEPVPIVERDVCFVSQLFLHQKKDGGWCPVFNLWCLNSFVRYEHFKMEGLFLLKGLLTKGAYLAKLDLKDAYFSIPLATLHHRFLSFQWNGIHYHFKVLCFGLASAPRVFTKVLKPILAILHRQGIQIIVFLDDILIINDSADGLCHDIEF